MVLITGTTYFPDFFAANITEYWEKQFAGFYKLLEYSGIWIDMNEVANFCNPDGMAQTCEVVTDDDCSDGCCGLKCSVVDADNKYDNAPYVPHVSQGSLGAKTIPASVLHQDGVTRQYDTHSLYGLMESIATNKAITKITGKRPFCCPDPPSHRPGSTQPTGQVTMLLLGMTSLPLSLP